jgi:membrane-bound lytic murein transglycosylase A
MIKEIFHYSLFIFCAGWVFSCARLQIVEPSRAMRPAKATHLPEHFEQGDRQSLIEALEVQIEYWQKREKGLSEDSRWTGDWIFGPQQVNQEEYLAATQELLRYIKSETPDNQQLDQYLRQNFDFYEVYGRDNWGEVLVTSYFEPLIEGRNKAKPPYTQALYRRPPDMVLIELGEFAEALPSLADLKGKLLEKKPPPSVVRGRLISSLDQEGLPRVVPYPDREAIDRLELLKGQGLELCYVDPIEAFFFHIQGSGRVQLPGGKSLHLTYHAQNGRPYYAIGRELLDVIPKEKMSLQRIEFYLRSLEREKQEEILFKNPSYVFFQEAPEKKGITYQGTPVVAQRTIATDRRLFPKGALAILEMERPQFSSPEEIEPSAWTQQTRLVVDQDTGGAIRGPGRVDFFWGAGKEAERAAGVMKNPGRLIYLVPKVKETKNTALLP